MKIKLEPCGVAFWDYETPRRWSVVIMWWHSIGVFINSPRYCRNFGRRISRHNPFDRLP